MGFAGLFKPKWQHADRYVRLLAVKDLVDEAVLAKVAIEDLDKMVRDAALERLKNPALLVQVAKTAQDFETRQDAIRRISDQSILSDIVRCAEEWRDRIVAVRRIEDQATLASIAITNEDSSVRREAFVRLTEPAVLKVFAKSKNIYGPDEYEKEDFGKRIQVSMRLEAIKSLKDLSSLVDVAKNASEPRVRKGAIHEISDQLVLKELLDLEPDHEVRREIVFRLFDDGLLAKLALSEKNDVVRAAAVQKIKDNALIERIAKTDASPRVREAAVGNECMNDPATLAFIVREDSDSFVRMTAVSKIEDAKLLADVASRDPDKDVQIRAIRNPHLMDQGVFNSVALTSKGKEARYAAVERISDPHVLSGIAKTEKDEMVLLALLENSNFTNSELIRGIAKTASDKYVRQVANSKAMPQIRGVLVIAPRSFEKSEQEDLIKQIASQQEKLGRRSDSGYRITFRVKSDALDDSAYLFASLNQDFGESGDIVERTVMHSFRASDGAMGNYYVIFDRHMTSK